MSLSGRIYGGYRERLGPYQVVLDGITHQFGGFENGDKEDFNAVLFRGGNLTVDHHQIEMTNVGDNASRTVLDISHVSNV